MRPLRDQMAHCWRTVRLPNAIDTPCNNRYTFGAALRDLTGAPAGKISDFSRGARGAALKRASPCERLVSGSTPNEVTSCLRTSRSEFSLFRLRKRDVVLKQHSLGVFVRLFQKSFHRVQARPHTDALIQMRCATKPLPQKGAYYCVRDRIAEGALTKQVAE